MEAYDYLRNDENEYSKQIIPLVSLFRLHDILNVLESRNKLSQELIMPFKITFQEREAMLKNDFAIQLWRRVYTKKTNLVLSADVRTMDELLVVVKEVGTEICMLKIHIDLFNDVTLEKIEQLKDLSLRYKFFIMEDRKFGDIGSTVKAQMQSAYNLVDWVDSVTAHSIFGEGTLAGIKEANANIGVFLVAQSSSKDNLIDTNYIEKTVSLGMKHGVAGFISQQLIGGPEVLYACPGVNIASHGDNLGQTYRTPEEVVKCGCDLIIVGRGIYAEKDCRSKANEYRERAWNALASKYKTLEEPNGSSRVQSPYPRSMSCPIRDLGDDE
jgi:orotidine 5'-phosphate decarboxylase subfamily 1